ncbi:MAG: hypothetical protein VX764_09075 [Planctomycetota bacterium]|nr:hypothetical protein [Planctomycetota bacterium]
MTVNQQNQTTETMCLSDAELEALSAGGGVSLQTNVASVRGPAPSSGQTIQIGPLSVLMQAG